MPTFIDLVEAQNFIKQAMSHYAQKAPGWFTDWLDDLYIRLGENWREITLDEVASLSRLYEEGDWMPQTLAVNAIYKLLDRLGRDTTGIIGY